MKLTRILFLSVFVSLVSFSFTHKVSSANVLTQSMLQNSGNNYTSPHDKSPDNPTLHKPNLDEQDGFDEEAHKRRLRHIKRQNKAAKKPIPTQKHNL